MQVQGKRVCISNSSHAAAATAAEQRSPPSDQEPDLRIPINCATATKANSTHSFTLRTEDRDGSQQAYVMRVADDQEVGAWISAIEDQRREYVAWERVLTSSPMPILSPSHRRRSSSLTPIAFVDNGTVRPHVRTRGSLYRETPLRRETTEGSSGSGRRKGPAEGRACTVCVENEVEIMFIPCHHLMVCADCAAGVTRCPYCRRDIAGSVRVFMP